MVYIVIWERERNGQRKWKRGNGVIKYIAFSLLKRTNEGGKKVKSSKQSTQITNFDVYIRMVVMAN